MAKKIATISKADTAAKITVVDGELCINGQKVGRLEDFIEKDKEDNYLISWHGYDHETHRTCTISIGWNGDFYVDGKHITTRTDSTESESGEETES